MFRRIVVYLPLVAALMAPAAIPAAAAARVDSPAQAACTADTPAVKALTDTVTKLSSALTAVPPDAAKSQQALGDVFHGVLAAQDAKCLPALPATPAADLGTDPGARQLPPLPPVGDTGCLSAVLNVLTGLLGALSAELAVPPDATKLTAALKNLADAVTALNKLKCLPVDLPVPSLPTPPPLPAQG